MAAASGKTNWFVVGVSSAVVVVLVALGGLVFWLNNRALDPGVFPETAAVDQETGAIKLGDGDGPVLQLYADFMCPYCNQFETAYAEDINELAANGDISYEFLPVGLLDNYSQGTEFSSRAANALYCVVNEEPALAIPFISEMFDNQPAENTTGLTDDEIIAIAKDAGVTADITSCVSERTYDDLVQYNGQNMPEGPQGKGTPTITWEGQYQDLSYIETILAQYAAN